LLLQLSLSKNMGSGHMYGAGNEGIFSDLILVVLSSKLDCGLVQSICSNVYVHTYAEIRKRDSLSLFSKNLRSDDSSLRSI
jgi:hypothetical protein